MTNPGYAGPSLSVALATYNGCAYLADQLESIAVQSLPASEIVIGDDQSSDATERVVMQFAERHPATRVRFERNAERLGTTRNFERIVRRCTGDIVVFADQDDLWMPSRLARLVDTFVAHPETAYVFSNGRLIDENAQALPGDLFSSVDFTVRERAAYRAGNGLDVLLRHNVVTGAALAVRRVHLDRYLPFQDEWLHDYYLAFVLEALASGVLLDEPLIAYRCHRKQQVGVSGQGSLAKLLAYARKQTAAYCRHDADNFRTLRRRLEHYGLSPGNPLIHALERKAEFFELRARMRAGPCHALGILWGCWRRGDYVRYALGWKQAAVDVAASLIAGRLVDRGQAVDAR